MILPNHEQSTLQEIGREGCYLLVVKRIAELERGEIFNAERVYASGLLNNWVRSDCLMLDSAALLGYLTGYPWEKIYGVEPNPLPLGCKYAAAEYDKKTPSGVLTHFVLWDHDKNMIYNPLVSMDLSVWKPVSFRAFMEKI